MGLRPLTPEENRSQWLAYLDERTSTYAQRVQRFGAVFWEMRRLGFRSGDLVVDVGAGHCEFDRYLRTSPIEPFDLRYVPVCGAIDGTDLDVWRPKISAEFYVAIEVVEHLHTAPQMLSALSQFATKGAIITTPNPRTVDVLELDRTHVFPVQRELLEGLGYDVRAVSLFGKPEDTLLGVYNARKCQRCDGIGWYVDHEYECYENRDCSCSGVQVQCTCPVAA